MYRAVELTPMSHTLQQRLAQQPGQWQSRERLTHGVSHCQPALEDALADLVITKQVQYRYPGLYRVADEQTNSTNGGV
jgi:hypothetical protein